MGTTSKPMHNNYTKTAFLACGIGTLICTSAQAEEENFLVMKAQIEALKRKQRGPEKRNTPQVKWGNKWRKNNPHQVHKVKLDFRTAPKWYIEKFLPRTRTRPGHVQA